MLQPLNQMFFLLQCLSAEITDLIFYISSSAEIFLGSVLNMMNEIQLSDSSRSAREAVKLSYKCVCDVKKS